ncbi:MAG TPA: flagellar basal-body rod protein FlgF [Propylenella sp.]|nr:flagellar basal-body rod protein FlgF [Propylenella sp.]
MQSALYVTLSAQIALERRLDTIAKNVANVSTAGYRADEITFDAYLSGSGPDRVAFASQGETYISRQAGPVSHTGNPLDVAVEGDSWFAIGTPRGPAYTRDGRMRMLESGALHTVAGYPVLDVGGAPIVLNADGGAPSIARDGMITQDGQQIGAIGLFSIDPSSPLERFENSAVIPARPAVPILDFTSAGILQGYVEGANVNPVMEMTKLILVSRAFESASALIQQTESSLQEGIRTLGEPS